ncbi:universal stress protein [Streptomyces zagrosensis]|uniref:Nucleotide-binding universal stress UspA family protein n=1 Tax=Streptomyces zagrosensis TaxID=1042984 RepID=A0A7W9QFS8_9ACTN|nr:universal stress protein [Streptomyces zagrosensis]MBB5938412.1 nucleotide-binding universal stress UspA family protein [Streptomyces zagrosensis]
MTRPITVGVDGSPASEAAADWAAEEAVRRRLPLRVVHAWQWEPMTVPVVNDRDEQAQWAQSLVREAGQRLAVRHPGLEITAAVLSGEPTTALVRANEDAELLVLGSRGHGALVGFLIGSHAQQVISRVARPVVSVRAPEDQEAARTDGEVVVGQQGSAEDSAAVLRFAFEAAAVRGAPLRAVRAWSLPPVFAYSPLSLRLADEAGGLEPYEKQQLAEALAPWREKFPQVPVREHVEIGSGGQVLLSQTAHAELLVLGRRVRRAPIGTRIGSVAHAALHHARCPVAVIPHD